MSKVREIVIAPTTAAAKAPLASLPTIGEPVLPMPPTIESELPPISKDCANDIDVEMVDGGVF